jgi:hypothetical protein
MIEPLCKLLHAYIIPVGQMLRGSMTMALLWTGLGHGIAFFTSRSN